MPTIQWQSHTFPCTQEDYTRLHQMLDYASAGEMPMHEFMCLVYSIAYLAGKAAGIAATADAMAPYMELPTQQE